MAPKFLTMATCYATTAAVLVALLALGVPASAGTLAAVSVSAPTQATGAVETWTVAFTTVGSVPSLGDVRIVLPAGFQTSSGAATVCDVTAPGTVLLETTTVASATEVVCNLGALDTIAAATGVSLTLTNIKNPTTAQVTGAFTVQTRNALNALIDEHTANTETISAAALTAVSASAPLQTTGAVETWMFGFTTVNAVAASGDVRVVLPAGFEASSGAATACDVTAPGTVSAETTTVVSATEVVCGLGVADSLAAGAAVTLTLTNIRNPTTAQTTGAFSFQTRDAVDAVHDQHTTNTEVIVASTLGSVGVSAPLQQAGLVETWTVAFTTANAVAGGGDIRVVLPAGFVSSSGAATVCDVTAPVTVAAESTTVASATEVVCNLDAGDAIGAGTPVTLTLSNVKNPTTAQTTGAFTIQTRAATDAVHDAHAANTEAIVARPLAGLVVSAPLQTTGSAETWTVAFNATNPVAALGDVRIVFPAGFETSSGAASVCDVTAPGTVSAETTVVVSATEVVCALGGADSIAAGAAVSVAITNVRNPLAAGTTGAFTVQTRDAADAVHDASATNTETIAASALATVAATGAPQLVGYVSTWTVTFTTVNPIPASGDVRVVFPAGFVTSSGAASVCDVTAPGTVAGESTVVVSGTEVVCELGAADSVAAGQTVTLAVGNVRNAPTLGTTAVFTIQTRDAADDVIDAHTTLTVSLTGGGGGGGGGSPAPAYDLPGSTVASGDSSAGSVADWTFDVVLVNGLGGDVDVRVTFPDGFVPAALTECVVVEPQGLQVRATTVEARVVSCDVAWASSLPTGQPLRVTVRNVTNPDAAVAAAPIKFELLDAFGRVMAEATVYADIVAVQAPVEPELDPVVPEGGATDAPPPPPVEPPGPTLRSPSAPLAWLAFAGLAVLGWRRRIRPRGR